MYFKKFPFAFQTIFSLHNLEADNFLQLQFANILRKGNPPIKKMVCPLVGGVLVGIWCVGVPTIVTGGNNEHMIFHRRL